MQSVVQLVNRLQGAATLLGDNAGTADSTLPSLWSMLPSIVVIGGQVRVGRVAGRGGVRWRLGRRPGRTAGGSCARSPANARRRALARAQPCVRRAPDGGRLVHPAVQ